MTRLAVIADDLTGALDAAAPFAARGLSTVVALGRNGLEAALTSGADIVGVSTDSREIEPDAARQAVAECVALLSVGLPIFKKVDSRLKGNIEAELDAIQFRRALVVPAIPDFGRWTRGGQLGGFGVVDPIGIAERLGHHSDQATIPDIAAQADITDALAEIEHDLPVGARGLAEALAMRLAPIVVPHAQPVVAAPAICVIGSTDPITSEQLERLRQAIPALNYIAAPDGVMGCAIMPLMKLTVLHATRGRGTEGRLVARHLGEGLLSLRPPVGATLFISGGATAQAVLRALGITALELLGEVMPGMPIAQGGGFTIITKSGGFGAPDALLRLFGHLGGAELGIHG